MVKEMDWKTVVKTRKKNFLPTKRASCFDNFSDSCTEWNNGPLGSKPVIRPKRPWQKCPT